MTDHEREDPATGHGNGAAVDTAEEPEAVAARRGLSVEEVAPAALLRAQAEGRAAARAEKVGA